MGQVADDGTKYTYRKLLKCNVFIMCVVCGMRLTSAYLVQFIKNLPHWFHGCLLTHQSHIRARVAISSLSQDRDREEGERTEKE